MALIIVASSPLSPAPVGGTDPASRPTAVLAKMVPAPARTGGILRVGEAAGDIDRRYGHPLKSVTTGPGPGAPAACEVTLVTSDSIFSLQATGPSVCEAHASGRVTARLSVRSGIQPPVI